MIPLEAAGEAILGGVGGAFRRCESRGDASSSFGSLRPPCPGVPCRASAGTCSRTGFSPCCLASRRPFCHSRLQPGFSINGFIHRAPPARLHTPGACGGQRRRAVPPELSARMSCDPSLPVGEAYSRTPFAEENIPHVATAKAAKARRASVEKPSR